MAHTNIGAHEGILFYKKYCLKKKKIRSFFSLKGRFLSLSILRFSTLFKMILQRIRIIVGAPDSNPGPLPRKSDALPMSLHISNPEKYPNWTEYIPTILNSRSEHTYHAATWAVVFNCNNKCIINTVLCNVAPTHPTLLFSLVHKHTVYGSTSIKNATKLEKIQKRIIRTLTH